MFDIEGWEDSFLCFGVLAGLIVVAGVGFRFLFNSFEREPLQDTPLAILQKRYARGEIDHQDFVRLRDGLDKNSP